MRAQCRSGACYGCRCRYSLLLRLNWTWSSLL